MEKETVYKVVSVEEVLNETKELSIPIMGDSGMVSQVFTFDCKNLDKEKYKALKPVTGYFHTKEEMERIIGEAFDAGCQYQYEISHLDEVRAPNKQTHIALSDKDSVNKLK